MASVDQRACPIYSTPSLKHEASCRKHWMNGFHVIGSLSNNRNKSELAWWPQFTDPWPFGWKHSLKIGLRAISAWPASSLLCSWEQLLDLHSTGSSCLKVLLVQNFLYWFLFYLSFMFWILISHASVLAFSYLDDLINFSAM